MVQRHAHFLRLMSVVWLASAAAGLRAAQTVMPAAVTPAQQTLRDQERERILHRELAQETQALQTQIQRKQERLAARDPAGVQESEAALQRHTHNIQLLRREIDADRARGLVITTAPKRRDAMTPTAPSPPATSAPSPEAVGRWWDVYARSARPGALGLQSPANAVDRTPVERPPRPPP